MQRVATAQVWCVVLLAGCTGDPAAKSADSADPGPPTWHRDIAPVVAARCESCHQPGAIAPFPLTSYDEAAPLAETLAASVADRSMPPWGAEPGHQSYQQDPSLDEATIAAFAEWAAAGAPEGDPASAGAPWPAIESPTIRTDTVLRAPEPYLVQGEPDDYRCFPLDWEHDETKWVTGFSTEADNALVVHHVAAYLFRPDSIAGDSVFENIARWDEADPLPGYTCYGGPSGDSDSQIPAIQLAQWVPGMGALPLPEGTGIEVPPGSQIVLQFHYFDPSAEEQRDQSGLALELADSVDHPGAFAPWLSALWAVGNMDIPAGEAAVEHETVGFPASMWDFVVEGIDYSDGFDIHSALFHMHKLGKRGELSVERADGSSETILVVDPWDFDWQRVYQLAQPISFEDGDQLRVSCTFDNSADNPQTGGAPQDVNWGEGTNDEMCVGNLYISER